MTRLKQSQTTLLIVTHRISALAYVDNLLVLSEGQIALSGPRDEVLARLQGRVESSAPEGLPGSAAREPGREV